MSTDIAITLIRVEDELLRYFANLNRAIAIDEVVDQYSVIGDAAS